ncbi:hypothetical protein GCM10022255_097170 [Dactylosporangium darangshiense]|uniref:Uncharacterized protein n=1 Tax=Dactylosporangium darangshiense TaxID=579108 RepID=A0ABP8DQV3_9ACTN
MPLPDRTEISPRSRSSICRPFSPLGGGEVVVGGAEVGVVPPLHATPLRANAVGTGLADVKDPLKPKDTVPPVAIDAL